METFDNDGGKAVMVREQANISVPVTVKPIINARKAVAYCCGDPVLVKNDNDACCRHTECRFIISQNICIDIPIEFSVDAVINGAYIDCRASDDDKEEDK